VEPPTLYRATPGLLTLGGVTSMRYLLAPAAVIGVVVNVADDVPGGFVERFGEALADRVPTDVVGLVLVAAAVIAAVVLAAAAGSLLVDWDFTLRDEGERFSAARGLLTRRVVHLDRDRIRGVDVRDTILRRPLGLVSVSAIAAGLRARGGGTTLAPVAAAADVPKLVRGVDPEAALPAAPLLAHPPAARPRRLVRALPLPLLALGLTLAFGVWWAAALSLVATALAVLLALDRYRQLGHAYDGRRLALRAGSLHRRWSELDPDAAVSFEIVTSPGQRRAGVATVRVHLGQGAGSRRALDIGDEQAAALLRRMRPQLFEPILPD
jgi:putative membrane protein